MRNSMVLLLLGAISAEGVILYGSGDPVINREVAPGGALSGSGWQYQGEFGNFMGTMISPSHFITAAHIGVSSTFISKGYFNGGSDVVYNVDSSANGGVGYWNVAGTDLRIFAVTGTFTSYAPLYTGSDEVGKDLVVMGRGTQRGATIDLQSVTKGWQWGPADGASRWGTNTVAATITQEGADYLQADFDATGGANEAHLSVGDSGGALFIQDGGSWKLAGINYAVDGKWDFNDTVGDGQEFDAALFDAGGLYLGSDSEGWTLVADGTDDAPSSFYSTRISSYHSQIEAITGIPEPRVGILTLALLPLLSRRRR
ncbi:trypsin-like serine protease [Haloferula chungangensis]|uniref:Trypsin-like serine protease n=1 Tax=Haloferula chungangensis TaxID=1048331 RepID=A0ABW2L6X9_9BACT